MSTTGVVVDDPPAAPAAARPAGGHRRPATRWHGWRAAWRIARREVRRRPWRSVLVCVLVAVPVGGMVVGTAIARTATSTADETWRQQFGTADAGTWSGPVDAAELPAGSRAVEVRTATTVLRTTGGRRARAEVTDLPLHDPLTRGIVHLVEGRPPERAGEVLISPPLADGLGTRVGGTISLERPEPATLTVTGLGVDTGSVDLGLMVLGAPQLTIVSTAQPWTLVDLPDGATPADVAAADPRLSPAPGNLPRYHGPSSTPDEDVVLSVLIGSLALTAAGTVIAAAFASGARRRMRTIGLLSAGGAPPAFARRVMLLEGAACGLAGGALGLVLAAAVLAWLNPRLDLLIDSYRDGVRWNAIEPLAMLGLGVLACTVAAAVPARTATGVPVIAALAGRPRSSRPASRLARRGIACFVAGALTMATAMAGYNRSGTSAGGTGWLVVLVIGAQGLLLGAVAVAPGLTRLVSRITVDRLGWSAGRLRGPWRLAARSLSRQSTHASAMVAAVCAACSLALVASAVAQGRTAGAPYDTPALAPDLIYLWASSDGTEGGLFTAPPAAARERARVELPEATAVPLSIARPPTDELVIWFGDTYGPANIGIGFTSAMAGGVIVADDAALGVMRLSEHARSELDAVGVLAVGTRRGRTVGAEQSSATGTSPPPGAGRFEVAVVPHEEAPGLLRAVITPARARELGFTTEPGPVVLRMPRPLDADERSVIMSALTPFTETVTVTVGEEPRAATRSLAELGLGAGALAVTLLVVAAGLALAGAESRAERDLLAVAGAGPRSLSRMSARKVVLIVLLGAALAVPVALAAITAGTVPSRWEYGWSRLPGRIPWRMILFLVLALPLISGFTTRISTTLAQGLRPVRVSAMTRD